MFEKGFRFEKSGKKESISKHIDEILLFRFKSKKHTYICEVEKYHLKVCAIKFYNRKDKDNPNKYNLLTGEGCASRIIQTCFDIILTLYETDKSLSFGFIGANLENESKSNTKRYRLYSRICANKFGDSVFEHIYSDKNSLYLFLNRQVNNPLEYLNTCRKVFNEVYEDLNL